MFHPLTRYMRNRRAPATTDRSFSDPFYRLHQEMSRFFDDAFSEFPAAFSAPGFSGDVAPRIDMRETDDGYEIDVELPGVAEDDIDVELSDNVLTVRGEKLFEKKDEDKKGNYRYLERSYGSFARSIPLSFDVDPDRVNASFKNGVLKLTLPKPPESERRSRKISIKKT